MMQSGKTRYDLIWNITRLCPWDCEICCVDAHVVRKKNGIISVKSNGKNFDFESNEDKNSYDQALQRLQSDGAEMTLVQKLSVIDGFDGLPIKVDFSGGDPLCTSETVEVISYCASKIGKENVTLTATGPGLRAFNPKNIARYLSEVNFTYDSPSSLTSFSRPAAYANSNLLQISKYLELGVKTRAECPLTSLNCDPLSIEGIYLDLHKAGVDTLLLMRLFPVGRGGENKDIIPNGKEYRAAISKFRELEEKFGNPKIKLQCALRFFDNPSISENPCDMVTSSFGLMPDGTLLASAWAYDRRGSPLSPDWVLGDLTEQRFSEIIRSEKAIEYDKRADENFGHCKIFSWLEQAEPTKEDIFLKTDPILK